MATLRLTLLGAFEARLGPGSAVSFPRKKAEALLAYLALHPGQAQARDKLAAILWGDASDERARHSLRQALVTLRQALRREGAAGLVEEGDTVGVDPAAVEVDVALFERLTAEGDPEALERAAALYRGDLLEGITLQEPPFEEWLRTERERLRELAVDTLAKLLAHQTRTGDTEQAVQTAVRLLGLDPAQEAVHRALMRLYARQGRRGAALRQYQVCVGVLERELGAEPEAETRQLYRELLQTRPQHVPAADPRQCVVPLVTPETALVGRTAELAILRQRIDDAGHGRGAVGMVQGEAGIGKTRLMEALIAEASAAGRHVLLGRAHESEQVLPLGPWVDAFRTGRVVPDLVEDLDAPWRAELSRLFPEMGPSERGPKAGEDYVRLFEALARTLQHLASARPVLLVLEDLHWADEMTLRLLVFLARRIHDAPVAVVGTLRLEEIVDAPMLRRTLAQFAHQPRFFTVMLAPLSEAETLALVRTSVRAKTDEASVQRLGQQIWHASEGNPFMVLETVRALQGESAAELERQALTPPRVRELIGGRLDRLSDRGRRLAAVASVIGREFDFALLERAAELNATEAAEGVEELVARRVLHVVGERLDFTHERIREVVYDGLLPPYRKRLHAATVQALEGLHAADLAPYALALGRHCCASDAWDRAADYLAQAGRSAVARAAHRESVACFEQAIDALHRLPDGRAVLERRIDLRFEVRHSCVPLRDHGRALEHLVAAETEAEAIGDRARLGWALVYRSHALFLSGDAEGATTAGQRGLGIAQDLADPRLEESANLYLGQVFHWVGKYRLATELLRRNVTALETELGRRGIDSLQHVNSRTFLAWCLAECGDFGDALAGANEAIAAADAAGSAYWLVHACCGAGLAHLRRGDVDAAIAVAERAVELCRGRDFTALWAIPASVLGAARTLAGRASDAIALLEPAAEIAGVLGAPILGFLGGAYLAAGRAEDARRVADRSLRLSVERAERAWQAWTLRLLGEIAASADAVEVGTADDAYRQAMALAAELGMRPLVAHCHLGLGRLYRRVGRHSQAREHITVCTTMYRELDMPFWLGQAERALEAGGT
jgi:DNA-binding SARP family transcriptional activator